MTPAIAGAPSQVLAVSKPDRCGRTAELLCWIAVTELSVERLTPLAISRRAVPGYWEGDLVEGSRGTFIATLVERHSRFVMLVKLSEKGTEAVVDALIKAVRKLPTALRKSLTWDRGAKGVGYVPNVSNAGSNLPKCLPCPKSGRIRVALAVEEAGGASACERVLISPYARHMLRTT